ERPAFNGTYQALVARGISVFAPNVRGSSGFGKKFVNLDNGALRVDAVKDIKSTIDHLIGSGIADRAKIGIMGGSYGGYMVNWIAGQWSQPWKCLVNHAGVFDTRVMAYSTDIQAFSEAQFRGLSRLAAETAGRFDPSDAVAKWKVPMLVIHGARDYRVPLDQGIAAHNAARRAGVPTEMLLFPDENHWVLKPQNSVQWYATVETWMRRWTGDGADSAHSQAVAPIK
ncbi:MAG: prolyl oligopeptidase family serine peptidase, partial [Sphingomicrobium sp.]